MEEKILILDFGSQYTQLIARRVRELNIYCEIFPYNKAPKNIENFKGLILSGSPFSVHDVEAPSVNLEEFKNIPTIFGDFNTKEYLYLLKILNDQELETQNIEKLYFYKNKLD